MNVYGYLYCNIYCIKHVYCPRSRHNKLTIVVKYKWLNFPSKSLGGISLQSSTMESTCPPWWSLARSFKTTRSPPVRATSNHSGEFSRYYPRHITRHRGGTLWWVLTRKSKKKRSMDRERVKVANITYIPFLHSHKNYATHFTNAIKYFECRIITIHHLKFGARKFHVTT